MSEKLIVSLDFPYIEEANLLIGKLGESVNFYKVGMELVCNGGLILVKDLINQDKKIMLDLKLHDIPSTVSKTCDQVVQMGVTYLTVHAYPQTMIAAQRAIKGSNLQILGVPVLTSYDDNDLWETGYKYNVDELTRCRAFWAQRAKISGLVLSVQEVKIVRLNCGKDITLVTPGIRLAGDSPDDQKRTDTPKAAIDAGANHIIVGRPITRAKNPRDVVETILQEISTSSVTTQDKALF